jgi:predicted acylesterase/phospholipase RssA
VKDDPDPAGAAQPSNARPKKPFHLGITEPFVSVWNVAVKIRVSLLTSLLLAAVFHVPQSLECFAVLGEDFATNNREPFVFALSLGFACLILWFSARVILLFAYAPGGRAFPVWRARAVRCLPWLAAAVPWLSACLACYLVSDRLPSVASEMNSLAMFGLFGLGLLIFVGWLLADPAVWSAERLKPRSWRPTRHINRWLFALSTWLAGQSARLLALAGRSARLVLLLGAAFFFISVWHAQQTTKLGPLAVCCVGAAFWCTVGSILVWYGRRIRFPVLNTAVVAVVLVSLADCNDNHAVRDLARADEADSRVVQPVGKLFQDWLSQRPDLKAYQESGKPYPVFVVSAQGGGIYAMHFTAQMLAELQARNSRFADHVFAISGVSGGSAGAMIFAALADQRAANQQLSFPETTARVLDHDFLSPVVTRALFSDALQQALFFRLPAGDRGAALEGAFEHAWGNVFPTPTLAAPLYALGDDFSRRSVPLLLFNTTQVETGRRIVISSVPISDLEISAGGFLHQLKPTAILSVSTAASLSARFPYVTPVASLEIPGTNGAGWKIRLADGGYFDNSGTSTLRDLTRTLIKAGGGGISFRLIAITLGTTGEATRAFDARHTSPHSLGEVLSPIRTMLNARPARSVTARTNLLEDVAGKTNPGLLAHVYPFSLDVDRNGIPLGWLLSKQGGLAINAQVKELLDRKPADAAARELNANPRDLLAELDVAFGKKSETNRLPPRSAK